MTIQEAHIDFKLKWDKVDNKYNRNFTDEEVDWLLNDAQLAFIRTRFNPSNIAKAGFESTVSRLNELSNILRTVTYDKEHIVDLSDFNDSGDARDLMHCGVDSNSKLAKKFYSILEI
jgi:hypothetical protein